MGGSFPFPVKYGYSTVGRVEAGPDRLVGRDVFALHPHQTVFDVPVDAALPVPRDVPIARAVLAANMRPAGKFRTAPPRCKCRAADFRTATRFEEAFASVIR